MRALAPILISLLMLGCVGPLASRGDADEPRAVVRQYLEAFYAGRAREAWAMHSAAANEGQGFDLFEEIVRGAAASAGGASIESVGEPQITGDRATVRVAQRLGGRTATNTFELVREAGGWRIHNPQR